MSDVLIVFVICRLLRNARPEVRTVPFVALFRRLRHRHRTRDDQPESQIHRAVLYNTKLLSCDRGRIAFRNEAPDATDLRTHRTQLLLDALVAAIDVVHTVDDGFAISYQRCQHE